MRRGVFAVVATAIVLAGCTGSDDDASDATGPTPSTSTAPTTSPESAIATTPATDAPVVVTPPPDGGGGESTGPLGSVQLDIDTGDGTVQIGAGSVPERLRTGFPLPPDLVVQLASETDSDLGFSGVSGLGFGELVALYEEGLPESGYVVDSVDRPTDDVAVIRFSDAEGVGEVAISGASTGAEGFTVIVAYGPDDPN